MWQMSASSSLHRQEHGANGPSSLGTRRPISFLQLDGGGQSQADMEEADALAAGELVPSQQMSPLPAEMQPAAPQVSMSPGPLRQELNLMQAALENEEMKEMKSVKSELELHEKEIMQEMKFSALQMEQRMLQVRNAAARQLLQSEALAGQSEAPVRQLSMSSLAMQQGLQRQPQPMMLRGLPQAVPSPTSWGRAFWQNSLPGGMANVVVMEPQALVPGMAQERPVMPNGLAAMLSQPQNSFVPQAPNAFMRQGYAPMPGQFAMAPPAGGYQGVVMAR